jgi:lysophospholipase L1-like esterase
VGLEAFPVAGEIQSWQFLSGVEVMAPAETTVLVAFGDSITDGAASTPDTNRRWPNFLARRLAERPDAPPVAVLDQGISGNRVLHDVIGQNALARFDRDVLAWPGVTHVIVLEGINDIGFAAIQGAPFGDAVDTSVVTADDLIAGYRQLIARAHAHGITIVGGTLTPYLGAGYASDEGEQTRQAVNAWIRDSGEWDAVIDFDAAVRDPASPGRMQEALQSGDWLHPSDAGYEAMAAAIDLSIFD